VLQKKRLISLFVALILLLTAIPLKAANSKCENMFPDLINDINYNNLLPLRLGGKIVLNGNIPDNVDSENPDDYNPSSYDCNCTVNNKTYYGVYTSFWEPARVIEVTMKPGCFNFLFGIDMSDSLNLFGATGERGNTTTPGDKVFYNVHLYSIPLLTVLDLIKDMDFCSDWMSQIDIMFFTEADPMWNDEELQLWINPEAAVFANPIATALCAVDCLTASATFPLNAFYWCAGCWGNMYPFSGSTGATGSPPRTTSLLASRILAKLARDPIPPAMELDTSGSVAKCGDLTSMIRPVIKKSQYRFQLLKPIPENGGHPLGQSTFLWGEWKNIPGPNETYIYLIWRKRNCCLRFL